MVICVKVALGWRYDIGIGGYHKRCNQHVPFCTSLDMSPYNTSLTGEIVRKQEGEYTKKKDVNNVRYSKDIFSIGTVRSTVQNNCLNPPNKHILFGSLSFSNIL